MLQEKETLEVIIPIYNEEACIDELLKRLIKIKKKLDYLDISFIFINDGSKDKSLEMLCRYADKYNCAKVISFSRNFGHQMAVTAGLDYSVADYICIIDADMQDPPELIEDMYKKAKEGYDVVYGKRISREGESFFKRATANLFYKLLSRFCDIEIPNNTGDFRLISKNVLDTLKQMRERHRFMRGMVPWVGFRSAPLEYNRAKRYAGKTKYPFGKMLKFALDAILSFSNVPLRIAIYLGLFMSGFGVLGILLIVYLRFFTPYTVPGISAVIVAVLMMGGFQVLMLGVMGEYIGRIFEESKKRPLYVINHVKNLVITS